MWHEYSGAIHGISAHNMGENTKGKSIAVVARGAGRARAQRKRGRGGRSRRVGSMECSLIVRAGYSSVVVILTSRGSDVAGSAAAVQQTAQ